MDKTCKDCCCFVYLNIEGTKGRCDLHEVFVNEDEKICSEYDNLNGVSDE